MIDMKSLKFKMWVLIVTVTSENRYTVVVIERSLDTHKISPTELLTAIYHELEIKFQTMNIITTSNSEPR